MSARIRLYEYQSEEIKITIELFFDEHQNLIIDGYDRGSRVKEYWGDSDYEYSATVKSTDVHKIFTMLNIFQGDQLALLAKLEGMFHSNTCYSEFRNWLTEQEIAFESFSWT